jgi:hypothetical protein
MIGRCMKLVEAQAMSATVGRAADNWPTVRRGVVMRRASICPLADLAKAGAQKAPKEIIDRWSSDKRRL